MSGALTITRGLPASGKTTWARAYVAGEPRAVRVNRDDLRQMIYGEPVLSFAQEEVVTAAQTATVSALLAQDRTVIVDDTHLRAKHARAWADLALASGAAFVVADFLDVEVDVCVARDAARAARGERAVGEQVIRDMARKFLGRPLAPVEPSDAGAGAASYVPDPDLPPAWLVDMDGTLALMGSRSPYDWAAVGRDGLNVPVDRVVRALAGSGDAIVIMSGRDSVSREGTLAWLERHQVPATEVWMRAAGDTRRDAVVKAELFDAHVRGRWAVQGVLDDRDQVVRLWRGMGLTCLQVAPGGF